MNGPFRVNIGVLASVCSWRWLNDGIRQSKRTVIIYVIICICWSVIISLTQCLKMYVSWEVVFIVLEHFNQEYCQFCRESFDCKCMLLVVVIMRRFVIFHLWSIRMIAWTRRSVRWSMNQGIFRSNTHCCLQSLHGSNLLLYYTHALFYLI